MTAIQPRAFRDACGLFGTGVTVITVRHDGHDHGMTANAFMSISLDPPLIAISIAKTAKMLPRIQGAGRFAVSVLGSRMEDLAWHFAGKPRPLAAAACLEHRAGVPVVANAVATFVCDVADELAAGDHTVVVGRVRDLVHDGHGKP
ncbi:MAG TPA: flavin reductase family protein, partial [Candidatus Binataceae bacterium]|nr:flavin reductase family protein [Candidatus Binataceae bacterium]